MGIPLNRIAAYLNVSPVGAVKRLSAKHAAFVIDSRKVAKGDVFVAVRGEKHDAHDFIDKALREKAALCIVSKAWFARKKPATGCFLPVEDTILAMLALAQRHLRELAIPVVGVTGSNGKTTTRAMIAEVLRRRYRVFETSGNFNNRIGLPLSVFRLGQEHDIAVLEMGTNHFGEIEELSKTVHPQVAVITNIGRGHLEFLKNRRGVLRAKTEILSGMGAHGTLIVNADDDLLHGYRPRAGIQKREAGFARGAYLRGAGFRSGLLSGTVFSANGQKVALPIPGRGAALDALLALAVGRHFGVSLKEGAAALKRVNVPGERMAVKKALGATLILDCYNANPDSLRNALELLKAEKVRGRKIAVLGNMAELGAGSVAFHREAGRLVKTSGFDVLLTVGVLGREMVAGALKSGFTNAHAFDSREELVRVMRASVRPGDVILIKGSHSMRMEEVAEAFIRGTHS